MTDRSRKSREFDNDCIRETDPDTTYRPREESPARKEGGKKNQRDPLGREAHEEELPVIDRQDRRIARDEQVIAHQEWVAFPSRSNFF